MKKVANSFSRMVLALTAAILMFSFLKTETHAANDTVVIDFSKGQTYTLTEQEMPEANPSESAKLSAASKDCFFLYVLSEAMDPKTDSILITDNNLILKSHSVLNKNPYQVLYNEIHDAPLASTGSASSGSMMKIHAGSSTGTYEVTINNDLLNTYPDKESEFSRVVATAFYAYGIKAIDANGLPYVNIKLIFKNPNSSFVKLNSNGTVSTIIPDKEFSENGASYKVTGDDEVCFTGLTNKSAKSVIIPDAVVHQNITYRVTAIGDKAFYKNKKVKSITVGSNVTSIGRQAFVKNRKLSKITIRSKVLGSISKKAIKGNSDKLVVKVPASKVKAYKKMFKKAGMSKLNIKKFK